ncbi:MAG: hypothetical protein NT011_10855 [Kiritimatiellaeota bacterium]|nr:hypothetical protein [Kiritimatiellota bacterium]
MSYFNFASRIKSKRILPIVVITCLILCGGILTGARIHGFSFASWHSAIDGSPHREVFFSKVNRYRTDDWIVMLPHMLAQRADQPPFAAENRLIGDGHYNMLITCAAPARDPMVLFRPQVWGYFISGDIGMAFQWWFYVFGTWIAVWLVLRRLTGNDEWTSACGATALLFSPFFQAWSLNCTPTVIFACGTLFSLAQLRTTRSTFQLLLSAVLLAWFGMAFLLTFNYLPYLVTLFYCIVFVFTGMAVRAHGPGPADNREAPRRHIHWPSRTRWACALLAVLCILGLGAYMAASNWETIAIIRNSDYPGQRLSSGGDQTIWHLFRGNVLSIKPPPAWRDFNPCEGAAFFLVFPLVVAALLRDWWRTRKPPHALLLGIAGYITFLLFWNLTGFPELLSRWTLMNRAPPFRTLIGLGIADILLLSVYVSHRQQLTPASHKDYVTPWIVSALWITFHVVLGIKFSRYFPDYSINTALIGGLFAMALAPLLYLAPRLVLPAIMLAAILTTYDVNPLARGGTTFIQENPLSQKIRTIDQETKNQGHQPVWIAYGDAALPNLFRMIGSRALNGVHAYSQFELWKTLDPEGQSRPVYNRYAHVVFEVPPVPDDFKINLVYNDNVAVDLHPDNPRFAALNVDYLLCLDNQVESLDRVAKLKKIYSYAGRHIYRVEHAP